MFPHGCDFRNNRIACPLNPENLSQLLEVLRGCFTNREDSVTKPAHTKSAELVVEELYPELTCEQWDVLDDG